MILTDKRELINILKPGDIILTNERGTEWFTPLIKISNFYKVGYKNRGWEHSILYLGQDKIVEANPDGITSSSLIEDYFGGYCNFVVLRHKFATQDAIDKWTKFCLFLRGKEYDFKAFVYFIFYSIFPTSLHFLLGKDSDDSCFNIKDAFFCAELIASGMREANIYCFERAPSKIRPIDFYNELIFDVVATYEEPNKDSKFIYKLKRFFIFSGYLFISILTPIILFIPFICYQLYLKNKNETK